MLESGNDDKAGVRIDTGDRIAPTPGIVGVLAGMCVK